MINKNVQLFKDLIKVYFQELPGIIKKLTAVAAPLLLKLNSFVFLASILTKKHKLYKK